MPVSTQILSVTDLLRMEEDLYVPEAPSRNLTVYQVSYMENFLAEVLEFGLLTSFILYKRGPTILLVDGVKRFVGLRKRRDSLSTSARVLIQTIRNEDPETIKKILEKVDSHQSLTWSKRIDLLQSVSLFKNSVIDWYLATSEDEAKFFFRRDLRRMGEDPDDYLDEAVFEKEPLDKVLSVYDDLRGKQEAYKVSEIIQKFPVGWHVATEY